MEVTHSTSTMVQLNFEIIGDHLSFRGILRGNPDNVQEVIDCLADKCGIESDVMFKAEIEKTTSPLGDDDVVLERFKPNGIKPNLLQLYQKIEPQNQTEQVLLITYYLQYYEDMEQPKLEDYGQCFEELQKVPVDMPSNLKSTVRNVVDRTDYLYNPSRGKFSLTLKGKEWVESRLQELGTQDE